MITDYISKISDTKFGDNFKLGIVVGRLNKSPHCGIAYNLDVEPEIIHFCGHNKTKHEGFDNLFSNIIVKHKFRPMVQESLCSFLDVLAETIDNEEIQIPYAYKYENYSDFDADNQLILDEHSNGLTCATFLLTLFHHVGIDLIDLDSWPQRDEDKQKEKATKQIFFRNKERIDVSREHILKMEEEIGCKRYRPEEVAISSALYNESSAPSDKIIEAGKELYDYIQKEVEKVEETT